MALQGGLVSGLILLILRYSAGDLKTTGAKSLSRCARA